MANTRNENNDKKFEELMTELEVIVKDLENGNTDLENSIAKYTEAMKIVKICSDKLNQATEAVNQILKDNGEIEAFEVEEQNIAHNIPFYVHNNNGDNMKKYLLFIITLCAFFPFNVLGYSEYIIPGGENIGIKIESDGVLVIGFYKIDFALQLRACEESLHL